MQKLVMAEPKGRSVGSSELLWKTNLRQEGLKIMWSFIYTIFTASIHRGAEILFGMPEI